MFKMFRQRFVSALCEVTTRRIVSFTGDTVELQCRTNRSLSIYWTDASETRIANTARGVISENPRLSLNNSTEGQFDLLINSAQLDDAGEYRCFPGYASAVKAELTLLSKLFYIDMLLREFVVHKT